MTNTSSAVLFAMGQNHSKDPPYGEIDWTLQIALTLRGLVSRHEDHGTASYQEMWQKPEGLRGLCK
jgi:hypothetical protein